MAKNLNSVSFTVLLIVLVMASTGFLKSEADLCGDLTTCPPMTFLGEGGDHAPCTDNNAACCDCCIAKFGSSNMCWAVVEGSDQHCHCYTKV